MTIKIEKDGLKKENLSSKDENKTSAGFQPHFVRRPWFIEELFCAPQLSNFPSGYIKFFVGASLIWKGIQSGFIFIK